MKYFREIIIATVDFACGNFFVFSAVKRLRRIRNIYFSELREKKWVLRISSQLFEYLRYQLDVLVILSHIREE